MARGKDATAKDVAALLKSSDGILIVSHQRPDGDCLGSATALLAALRALGKTVAAYNPSETPRILRFLALAGQVKQTLPNWVPAVTVFVDCGSADRVEDGFQPRGTVVNIDHHATNTRFGDLNYIDTAATAVGEQIRALLAEWNVPLTRDIATALYTSLATDTGCFRYSNTSDRAFVLAAELVRAGARPSEIASAVYESKTPGEIVLTGRCLASLRLECGGRLAWAELRNADYAAAGGTRQEPEGLAAELRSIEGVELSMLFTELEEGGVRASLRGRGRVDCAALAGTLGGGGHAAAAGFTRKRVSFEAVRDDALAAARNLFRD